jgi:site-specific recombinase XerD
MNEATVGAMIRRYAAAMKLAKPTDTRALRRTCATHLLLGGAHPVAVAQLLGHADLTSLSHYLRNRRRHPARPRPN